jgi:SH3-like domain-containing protein
MNRRRVLLLLLPLLAATFAVPDLAVAQGAGQYSGLPVPRFASLRNERTHVRGGPTLKHEIKWTFTRAGLPVEIVAEFETWRRIRDSDGAEGWVHQALLAGRRTALIAPSSKEPTLPIFDRARGEQVTAQLQPGVLATVRQCREGWCRISGERFDGYIEQTRLWGVYPDEPIE